MMKQAGKLWHLHDLQEILGNMIRVEGSERVPVEYMALAFS